ncbi:MAG: hypothetical protein WC823_01970 [Parcubacteria group bacterium]|jgi:hypothetical protein
MEQFLKKYYSAIFFAVALLLLSPTLQGGYIFLLDWTVTPVVTWADIRWGSDPVTTIGVRLASMLISFAVWQRLFLLGIVFLLGLAGFRLARRTGNVYAQYFAGLLLIFNPFIYARLAEQPGIAAGSAALFWSAVYLLEYLEEVRMKKLFWAAGCAGLAVAFFPHSLFLVALLVSVLLLFDYGRRRNLLFLGKSFFMLGAGVLLLNANWMAGSFLSQNTSRALAVAGFTAQDAQAFATRAIGGDSVYFTVLALQGYWGEYQDRFISVEDNPLWEVAFLLILLLAGWGIGKTWKKSLPTRALVVVFGLAWMLAIGVTSPIFAPVSLWLYDHVPFYLGLREPQKWVALLVLAYAYWGSWGVKYLLAWKGSANHRKIVGIFCIALPVVFSFSMLSGLHAHLTPHQFPAEWQAAKNYLIANPISGKILFLPWHQYAQLDFADKNVVVPAQAFFGPQIVQGNNTEFGEVYSHALDASTLTIEKYVSRKDYPAQNIPRADFSKDMQSLGIDRVLLAKTEDWQDYAWLDRIGIEKVLENDKLIIYKL